MTIEEMKRIKNEREYTNEYISRISGVPLATVQKIFAGQTKSPRYDTMQALERVLTDDYFELRPSERIGEVREEVFKYEVKKQGEYTIADIEDLPEDCRVELIDGHIYIMESPTYTHQEFIMWMAYELKSFVKKTKGQCRPLASPLDVQLDKDDKTLMEPDLMVVCDREKITRKRIFGAPEMIVEVLSPSTRKRDLTTKVEKFQRAGVREYWIVDLDKERVIVYDFKDADVMHIYTFDDEIPVAIWDGKCVIDMKEFKEEIAFLGD